MNTLNNYYQSPLTAAQNTAFIEGYARMMRQYKSQLPRPEFIAKSPKKSKAGPSPLRNVTYGPRGGSKKRSKRSKKFTRKSKRSY